ncbi:MAG TPA: hypothetical protein VFW07_03480 [Parafilimonas sp.]|nr:hypothetical protein [Parafilimonas sp.]
MKMINPYNFADDNVLLNDPEAPLKISINACSCSNLFILPHFPIRYVPPYPEKYRETGIALL